ncbi:A-kinase anchor protein 13 [Dissostichus eleginoides]|uniref:A-kinase anchor protein 13 n=1 Tax=Dissostichus eleginoides TaxID=100907 RepID=A0AAD9F6W9_DISEL|nr:A-kinase anchor protein 13 [Dissostichus eleginoides]
MYERHKRRYSLRAKGERTVDVVLLKIHRDREASFHQPCNTQLSESYGSSQPSEFPSLPSRTSSFPSSALRDSGSDIESLLSAEPGYDSVFRKSDDPVTGGDSTSEVSVSVSCSSTDETSSSLEGNQGLDILRNSIRSLSPLRRHSWGPGKNNGGDAEMNHRSSIHISGEEKPTFHRRSYSLEGLSGIQEDLRGPVTAQRPLRVLEPSRRQDYRGSLVSLSEIQEEQRKSRRYRPLRNSCPPMALPLTKSVSMLAISQRDLDGMRSFSSASGSLAYSISEEEPGPLRSDADGKSTTKSAGPSATSRTRCTRRPGLLLKRQNRATGQGQCFQCSKAFNSKEAFLCSHCNASVHKSCRDSLPVCAKVKMKQQFSVPDSAPFPTDHSSSSSLGLSSRRHTSIIGFHGNNLSKSLSISNIAGPVFDDIPIRGLRYLSQSTDSLNRTNQVTESMESLTDEGTEMMDGQLMGEFEAEAREMEADSWSLCAEQEYLQQLDKELVKKQDVIYELMQTELHHIRTLRILSEVYRHGLQKELTLELQTVERLFPVLDELLELHTQHLLRLLERKRESQLQAGGHGGGRAIHRIGDLLLGQFSGSNGESMKRVYGRFCSRHNEAVNLYKELLTKDKRFKACIKKKMSSSIVRRLEDTKYPVLIQRMLQHTRESEEDHEDLSLAVRLVKEVIAAVDSKVNDHEKRKRLKDFHGRMDSKSIMMMKSGQIFAREDLLRRRLVHDGGLQLKNVQGRLKDVHALLLSDVFVFLQEKDQKYIFSMLKLIVREVANEERGLFLITAGIEKPEMMEVLAGSKEERNTWMQLIQEAMQSMEKDEDEGIPTLLRQKDSEILSLLEEKVSLFRGMWEGPGPAEQPFFRSACSLDPPRGAAIMKDALQEVETLQGLVNGSLGGAMASVQEGGGSGGSVSLPRRAETFGGFDSHQMHSSKSGDGDDSEDSAGDLRRTESDSVLKKSVLNSVSNLHLLLSTLQQDSFMEDQRLALSSSSSSSSRPPPRPGGSLIEQEKQRSLEKQRQESRKEEYQRDLERLRDAQRKLERDREAVHRQIQKMEEVTLSERTPSTASDDSQSLEPDPQPEPPPRSRPRGKGLNPFSSSSLKGNEAADPQHLPEPPLDGEIFFC